MNKALLLFESTRSVIKAERICQNHGIAVKAIPVPRSISSQCGVALQVSIDMVDTALKQLQLAKIAVQRYGEDYFY
ncbi:MAG: DUF3343 domain-containing protein [Chitinivibrionales bacterium]|nr:DUF3343 domain-containing protein [Chitinivibrionales bacterium]